MSPDKNNFRREIPVKALADEVQRIMFRRGYSWSDVCDLLGWERVEGGKYRKQKWTRADPTRIQRRLGLMPYTCKDGTKECSKTIHYTNAVEICKALDIYPLDVGL